MEQFINKVICSDCLEVMKDIPDNSVDSVVTDPPYELGFMGKSWDNTGIANNPLMWKECLRVLKPGGHLLAFSGTRTYHRMASAIEDAGFEIRDMIEWVYGSGFPKSLNIGKVMDKYLKTGNASWNGTGDSSNGALGYSKLQHNQGYRPADYSNKHQNKEEITEDLAKKWEGWGTALKPAHEPICMARKPLTEKTVAENVLKYGTGGINIDESRVGTSGAKFNGRKVDSNIYGKYGTNKPKEVYDYGRFPVNLIHDNSDEVRECFPETKSAGGLTKNVPDSASVYGKYGVVETMKPTDSGNASRFFKSIIYQAKASKSERLLNEFNCAKIEVWKTKDENMELAVSLTKAILDLLAKSLNTVEYGGNITAIYPKDSISTIRTTIKKITELKTWNSLMHSPTKDCIADVFSKKTDGGNLVGYAENSSELMMRIGTLIEKVGFATEDVRNAIYQSLLKLKEQDAWQIASSHHPTHKPIALMSYLIKMVTPKGGIVLDPFAGSGSTLVAAKQNGYQYIGIELTEEYIPIINARLTQDTNPKE